IMAISMLIFVCNRATNILPIMLGLFFKINGTSSRVLTMLSNVGVCVSKDMVEWVKKRLSEDAINLAVQLMTSSKLYAVIFDNINIYLRKFQQRVTNHHSMINATNAVVIEIDEEGIDVAAAQDLDEKLKLRGNRNHAKAEDILPTQADGNHIFSAFEAHIAQLIVRYCPGNENWEKCTEILEEVGRMMPEDHPLQPKKTEAYPLGVFDENEGSKKGIIGVLTAIKDRLTLTAVQWASKVRTLLGDWLTSNNFCGARRDRMDDINNMEWLAYGQELSTLWHYALQATHMIMHIHFGFSTDPTSLAAHKTLLGRSWDVKKPNYAAGKSLIRHSLIVRLLHMAIPKCAEDAQTAGNDWLAHSIYFVWDSLLFCEFEDAVAHADAGRHNYARECVGVLLIWKYELSNALRATLEHAWFYNRWGIPGRFIATDLYMEQLNYWLR
ncbi:hypothetical protein ARMGADRAFT_928383, partial [Armillaria gallica]